MAVCEPAASQLKHTEHESCVLSSRLPSSAAMTTEAQVARGWLAKCIGRSGYDSEGWCCACTLLASWPLPPHPAVCSCVIRGCVPKKLLVYGSHVAEELADAQGLGWTTQGTHNWNDLVARKASADEQPTLSAVQIQDTTRL